jgi:hypothetical protein
MEYCHLQGYCQCYCALRLNMCAVLSGQLILLSCHYHLESISKAHGYVTQQYGYFERDCVQEIFVISIARVFLFKLCQYVYLLHTSGREITYLLTSSMQQSSS